MFHRHAQRFIGAATNSRPPTVIAPQHFYDVGNYVSLSLVVFVDGSECWMLIPAFLCVASRDACETRHGLKHGCWCIVGLWIVVRVQARDFVVLLELVTVRVLTQVCGWKGKNFISSVI